MEIWGHKSVCLLEKEVLKREYLHWEDSFLRPVPSEQPEGDKATPSFPPSLPPSHILYLFSYQRLNLDIFHLGHHHHQGMSFRSAFLEAGFSGNLLQ